MMNMLSAVNTLLKNGESILIYPEQNLWWNYRKPRPYKIGGFKMAYHAGVPVIPTFITMEDSDRLDENGYPLQIHTLHILPPVFPDASLGEKAGAEKMMEETFEKVKKTYEEVYQKPLRYDGE
jgi:1-acyl-sn-glycerol-3-phosphate acyltransferase